MHANRDITTKASLHNSDFDFQQTFSHQRECDYLVTATHYNTALQHTTTTHCNTLQQRTATHYSNALQHLKEMLLGSNCPVRPKRLKNAGLSGFDNGLDSDSKNNARFSRCGHDVNIMTIEQQNTLTDFSPLLHALARPLTYTCSPERSCHACARALPVSLPPT